MDLRKLAKIKHTHTHELCKLHSYKLIEIDLFGSFQKFDPFFFGFPRSSLWIFRAREIKCWVPNKKILYSVIFGNQHFSQVKKINNKSISIEKLIFPLHQRNSALIKKCCKILTNQHEFQMKFSLRNQTTSKERIHPLVFKGVQATLGPVAHRPNGSSAGKFHHKLWTKIKSLLKFLPAATTLISPPREKQFNFSIGGVRKEGRPGR